MPEETENQSRVGRTIALLLILVALCLAVFVTWRIDAAPRTDDAYAYADTISVTPEVSGQIVELAVRDNQAVKRGDLLFKIDPRPFEASLAKAQATLTSLDREIELTQRSVNAQKLGAAAATASVERARAAAEQAADTLRRMEPLLGSEYVAAEQVDQARTAQRSAKAQLSAAVLDAQRATAGISGVDALVAKREVVKAEIALAELNLEYATVRAPFDGIVINLKTTAGQFAAAGHPVFTLANTTRWYVVANFRETELAHIKPGQSTQVYVLGQADKRFRGVVDSVGFGVFPDDGGADAAGLPHVPRSINWVRVAQRFPVRILVNAPDPTVFRIGASAVAIVTSDTASSSH
ncbi:multidrug transporter subunit MdtN [Cupriavidus basilensis]|uniref:Multidrug transporter subunit MdtN n=1 Tax=Cupriavidus basilensis TaxID=68895 RepID=A0A643FT54_9BURK|nr:multidrug transporter subunit MdtN [Cupriavidus basilensis]QOT79426.1 multidrug transporter subunit MdtN [Cupriavidus basilensis]